MPNPVVIGETAPQTALPAQVDIYDFDKTLVPFDSGSLFIGYCALHYPWVLVYLPVWFIACLLFALRVLSLQKFKNLCFGFLPMVPVQRAAKGFWEKHLHQVYPWFTQKKRPAVIISASPDWKPGWLMGKKVKSRMSLYVEFRLEKKGSFGLKKHDK